MTTTVQIALLLLLVAAGTRLLWKPALRVDDRGLRVPGARLGLVPWHAIEGVWQPSRSDSEALHVRLRDDVLPCRSRRTVLRIDLRGTDLSASELAQEILARATSSAPLTPTAPDPASRLSS